MDVFISYCRKDHEWKERVATFMQSMRRHGHFDYSTWDDGEIKVSDTWKDRIVEAIDNAKIAILLISPDFLASSFINDVEIPQILAQKKKEKLHVVPVIVRPTPWEIVGWLSEIQLHPPNGEALSHGSESEIEEHLKDLTLEVHRLVQQSSLSDAESADGDTGTTDESERATYSFIGDAGVRSLIKTAYGEDVVGTLLLYQIKTQQVWIATTSTRVCCIIDSKKTARTNRMIQWSQKLEPKPFVDARSGSRLKHAGTVDVGKMQNWLYSHSLHSDPASLRDKIEKMLNDAIAT